MAGFCAILRMFVKLHCVDKYDGWIISYALPHDHHPFTPSQSMSHLKKKKGTASTSTFRIKRSVSAEKRNRCLCSSLPVELSMGVKKPGPSQNAIDYIVSCFMHSVIFNSQKGIKL